MSEKRSRVHVQPYSPTFFLFFPVHRILRSLKTNRTRISSGPEVSIPFRFGLGERADGLAKAPSPSRDALTVREGNVSSDCEAALTGWGRSPYVQIDQSCREWWESRDSGWEGRHGTRFTCPQPAVSQLHMLQSTAINPSQLTLVCHKLTVPAWLFVTWNCSRHGIANTDSKFTWLRTPFHVEARRQQLSASF